MTINPSSTRELDIAAIIRRAYQFAGLMTAQESLTAPDWTARAEMGADFLGMIMNAMQPGAVIARHVVFTTIAVVAGTASYAAPASVLSYVGHGMFKETGEDTELAVVPMSREDYQLITDKTISGRPNRYYLHRTATTQTLYLDPLPDAAGTLTMQTHQLVADSNVTSYTPDLERHWDLWLVYELAHLLAGANTLPVEERAYLRGLATAELEKCRGYSKQNLPVIARIGHRTQWSG